MSNPLPQCSRCRCELPATGSARLCDRCFLIAALDPAIGLPVADEVPERLGNYDLLGELARGGMGVVYRARDRQLNRWVALKTVTPGHANDPAFVARFRAEAEAVAQLDHPNIVPIYEVGEAGGRVFLVMPLMEGGSLAQRLNEVPAAVTGAGTMAPVSTVVADWMVGIARGVHHAHQRGILHRDLKPANILLDDSGQPQVTDFGLAKQLTATLGLTATGAALGTPNYMSPEQAGGDRGQITTATDVYSLGAILYELLTLRPPFAEATAVGTLRAVLDTEPSRPRLLNARVDRDLETICLRCLEKQPLRRYGSAGELADDLERWRRHEPILARPSTPWERVAKWARRRPAVAALGVVVVVAVVTVIGVLAEGNRRISREARAAAAARDQARRSEQAEAASRYSGSLFLAQVLAQDNDFRRADEVLTSVLPAADRSDRRGFEWRLLRHQAAGNTTLILATQWGSILGLAWSPDGQWIAAANDRGRLRIWNAETGRLNSDVPCPRAGAAELGFSPLDQSITARIGPPPLRRWESDGTAVPTLLMEDVRTNLDRVVWSRDGHFAASRQVGFSSPLVVLDSLGRTAAVHRVFNPVWYGLYQRNHAAVISNVRSRSGNDAWELELRLLPPTSDSPTQSCRLPADFGTALAVSDDGRRIAYQRLDLASVGLFATDLVGGVGVIAGFSHPPGRATFSRDGTLLAIGGEEQCVRIWNVINLTEATRLTGVRDAVDAFEFSPDGRNLVAGSRDGSVRIWRGPLVPRADLPRQIETPGLVEQLLVIPGEPAVVATAPGGPVQIVRLDTGRAEWVGRYTNCVVVAASVTNITLLDTAPDGSMRGHVWDRILRREIRSWTVVGVPPGTGWQVDTSSQSVMVTTNGCTVSLRAIDGVERWRIRHETGWYPRRLACSIDGVHLFFHRNNGSPRLLDRRDGRVISVLTNVPPAEDHEFAPDGSALVARSGSRVVIYTNQVGRGWILSGSLDHGGAVATWAFSVDGHRVATAGRDGTVKFWSWTERRELLLLRAAENRAVGLRSLTFTPDGEHLVAGDASRNLYVWSAPR